MRKPVMMELLHSKKFLVLLWTILLYVGARMMGISQDEMLPVLLLVGMWLFAQGAADFGKEGRAPKGEPGHLRLVS